LTVLKFAYGTNIFQDKNKNKLLATAEHFNQGFFKCKAWRKFSLHFSRLAFFVFHSSIETV